MYGACCLVTGVLGIAANLVEMVNIYRRNRKTSFDAIVASLSIADTISGILFAIIGIGGILCTSGIVAFSLVKYAVIGLNFSVMASLNHVLVIVIQRVISAFAKESIAANRILVAFFFLAVWGSATLYGILSLLVIKDFITLNSIIIVAYTAATTLSYVPIFYRERQKCSSPEASAETQNNKALLHSILLTLCCFACYFPFALNNLVLKRGFIVGSICDILIAINPSIDALIYFYVNRGEPKKKVIDKTSSEHLLAMNHV